MKKLLALLAALSATSAYADNLEHFTGSLTIDTTTVSTPYINASANTITTDPGATAINGYKTLQSGINNLYFNTVMKKGGYLPYNINFGLNFGGMGLDGSSVGWTANGDTPGSTYTFSIMPPMYPVGQTPPAGDYCITVSVNGNAIHDPVCSIAIKKGDNFNSDIWYAPQGVTNVLNVSGFSANSNVTVTIRPGKAQVYQCKRATEWGTPDCQPTSSLAATKQSSGGATTNSVTSGASRLFY